MPAKVFLRATFVVVSAAAVCGCATAPAARTAPACPKAQACCKPPLKVAVYADAGPSGIGAAEWFRLVNESPEMELHLVDGEAVRAGALEGLDLLVMPGGSSKTEFETLGTNGVKKLKSFVRNGGGYIGTCAGCCLLMDGEGRRARMMPWNTCGNVDVTFFPTFQINEKGAFKYVTGRDVTFPLRPRTPHALSVGFVAGGISGVDTAETLLALAAEKDFDVVLIDADGVRQRRLDHVDVLVIPSNRLAKDKVFASELSDFVSRGGKVLGFKDGRSLLPPGGIACGTRQDAVKAIRRLFAE